MKTLRQQPRRPMLVGLLFTFAIATTVLACQVPVFRYALERWNPDQYQVVVLSAGKLDNISLDAISSLTKETPVDGSPMLRLIDVAETNDDMAKSLRKKYAVGNDPVMVTLYPASYRGSSDQVAHACSVSESNVQQIVDSPVRQELVKRLTAGDSAVWVLLESGDRAKDEASLKTLEDQLAKDTAWLALPSPEELEIKPEILEKAKIKLQISFSVISVRRDDPQEKFLVDGLLNSESDLQSFDEPIAFPVFGRGRVLYALVGQGIAADTIRSASSFMVGPCSCQVKEQNPGFDLLLKCDWDAAVGETFISSPLPGAAAEPKLLTIPPGRSSR